MSIVVFVVINYLKIIMFDLIILIIISDMRLMILNCGFFEVCRMLICY